MAVFREAITTFGLTKARLETAKARIEAIDSLLDAIARGLKMAPRLKSALERIRVAARRVRQTLNGLRTPPAGPWGLLFRALKEAVETMLRGAELSLRAAGEALDAVDEAMTAVKGAIATQRTVLSTILGVLNTAITALETLTSICEFLEEQQDDYERLLGPAWVTMMRQFLEELKAFNEPLDRLNDRFQELNDRLQPIKREIDRVVDELDALTAELESFADELEEITTSIQEGWQSALDKIDELPAWIKNAAKQAWEAFGQFLDEAEDVIEQAFAMLPQDWQDSIREAMDAVGDALDEVQQTADDLAQQAASAIDPVAEKAAELAQVVERTQEAVEALEELADAAKSSLEEVQKKIDEIAFHLVVCMLLKLWAEHFLGIKLDELELLQDGLEGAELEEQSESGEAEELLDEMDKPTGELYFVIDWAYPMSRDPRVPAAVARTFEEARDAVLTLKELQRQLREAAVAAKAGEAVATKARRLKSGMREQLDRLSKQRVPVEPGRFAPGYFENAARLMGLPTSPKEAEVGTKKGEYREWGVTVWNDTEQTADDLHVLLSGTGGSLQNPRIVVQPDASDPATVRITNGNQIDVVWPSPCVRPGDTVIIVVETQFVPLEVVSATWTLGGEEIK